MKQSIHLICAILATTLVISHAQDDQKQFLDAHNTARAQVGAGPLSWNQTLASYAQDFANKVKQKCENTAKSGGPYGENTASGYGAFSNVDAVNQWVKEKSNYDPKSNKCINKGMECKHYAQVVSKETTQLGCASVTCGAGWPFVVCEYFPAGKVPGKKRH